MENKRKEIVGIVISDKNDKTITVKVETYRKHKTGYYFLINVESDAEAIKEFDRLATISEELIRHIIVKLDK